MNGRIAQEIGDLCKIQLIFPDKLFCKFYLHICKKFDDPTLVLFSEKLLKLGTSNEIVVTDVFYRNKFPDMFLQIKNNLVIYIGTVFWRRKPVYRRSEERRVGKECRL